MIEECSQRHELITIQQIHNPQSKAMDPQEASPLLDGGGGPRRSLWSPPASPSGGGGAGNDDNGGGGGGGAGNGAIGKVAAVD